MASPRRSLSRTSLTVNALVALVTGLYARAASAQSNPTEAALDSPPASAALEPHCREDARLVAVADEALTRALAASTLDGEALARTARHAGVAAAGVRAWVGRSAHERDLADTAGAWLGRQRVRRAWARCAWSSASLGRERDGRIVRALVLVPRVAEVRSAGASVGEIAVSLRSEFTLETVVPAGARAASWYALGPDGVVRRASAGPSLTVRFDDAGAWRLQLVAETDEGPLPFAVVAVQAGGALIDPAVRASNAPVVSAAEAPAAEETVARNGDDPTLVRDAREVRAAINRTRTRLGLVTLRADPVLDGLARERAARLAQHGVVAHRLAPEGVGDASPEVRLQRAGLRAARVAENVVRARSISEAFARLEQSPAHRAVRLEPSLDALGVGAVTQGDQVYLVELYASHPALSDGSVVRTLGAEDREESLTPSPE